MFCKESRDRSDCARSPARLKRTVLPVPPGIPNGMTQMRASEWQSHKRSVTRFLSLARLRRARLSQPVGSRLERERSGECHWLCQCIRCIAPPNMPTGGASGTRWERHSVYFRPFRTVSMVPRSTLAEFCRPMRSFGHSSISTWPSTPTRPTTVGTEMLTSRRP